MSSVGTSLPVLEASDLDRVTGYLKAHQFFWLDLHDPTPDLLKQLGELTVFIEQVEKALRAQAAKAKVGTGAQAAVAK